MLLFCFRHTSVIDDFFLIVGSVFIVQAMSDSGSSPRKLTDESSDSDESEPEEFDNNEPIKGVRKASQSSSASPVKSSLDVVGRSRGILVQ